MINVIGGEGQAMAKLVDRLMKLRKVSVEEGQSLNFLKRTITVTPEKTEIAVNSKYIEGLLKLLPKFGGAKKSTRSTCTSHGRR